MQVFYQVSQDDGEASCLVMGEEGQNINALWREFREDFGFGLDRQTAFDINWGKGIRYPQVIKLQQDEHNKTQAVWIELFNRGIVTTAKVSSSEMFRLFADWLVEHRNFSVVVKAEKVTVDM